MFQLRCSPSFRGHPWRDWCSFKVPGTEEESLGRVWGILTVKATADDGTEEEEIVLVVQQFLHVSSDDGEGPDGMLPAATLPWPTMIRGRWTLVGPNDVVDAAYVLPVLRTGLSATSGDDFDLVFWLRRSLYSSLIW